MTYYVDRVRYKDAKWLITNLHYSHTMPMVQYAFGLFKHAFIVGIATYGKPAAPKVAMSICGQKYADIVYELNRLVLMYNNKNEASMLVGRSIKLFPSHDRCLCAL